MAGGGGGLQRGQMRNTLTNWVLAEDSWLLGHWYLEVIQTITL